MKQTLTIRFFSGWIPARLLFAVFFVVSLADFPESRADDLFTAPAVFGGNAGETGRILPVDEAFRFGSYEDGESLHLFWQVSPGYYLYRDKFRFEQAGLEVSVELPGGQLRQDEIFGEVEVLTGLVEVSIPPATGTRVSWQGCAERGYCYPPQKIILNSVD